MKNLLKINRILLAGLWSFLAYSSLFPIEVAEVELFSILPLNWYWVPLFTRLIFGSIFVLALFIILHIHVRLNRVLALFFWFLFMLDVFVFQSDSKYTGLFISPLLETWIYSILLFALTSIYFFDNVEDRWKKNRSFLTIGLTLVVLLPFILNPVYPEDFSELGEINTVAQQRFEALKHKFPEISQRQGPHLYAFYSVGCKFCKISSRKLQEGLNKFPSTHVPVTIIYWGNDELIERFQQKTQNTIPFLKVEDETFVKFAGDRYPSFLLINKEQKAILYTGSTFNYFSYQNMCTYVQ